MKISGIIFRVITVYVGAGVLDIPVNGFSERFNPGQPDTLG